MERGAVDSTWTRLKQRKLFQWGAAYLAMAWALTEGIALLADSFHWPEWVVQAVIVLLAFGFPAALTLAWFHGEKGHQRVTGAEVGILAVIGVLAILAIRALPEPVDSPGAAGAMTAGVGGVPGGVPFGALADSAGFDYRSRTGALRVAVLPFANLTPDPDVDQTLVEGLDDEVATQVSKVRAIEVVARSSSERFAERDERLSPRDIGDSLRARYLIEGSVLRAGDRVRVQVSVVDVSDERTLWSESYNEPATVDGVFDVQSDVALNVARALEATLVPEEEDRILRQETSSQVAYETYLQGRHLLVAGALGNYSRAAELMERAVSLDPDFAAAWGGLAMARVAMANYFMAPPMEAFPIARDAAERALELDPAQISAHVAMAWVRFSYEWDWDGAERQLQLAEAISPGEYGVYYLRAFVMQAMGRYDEAIEAVDRMLEVSPLGPSPNIAAGLILHTARRYDEALAMYRRGGALSPDADTDDVFAAFTNTVLGRDEEAVSGLQIWALGLGVEGAEVARLSGDLEEGGMDAVWERWLEWAAPGGPSPRPGIMALAYARLGNGAQAAEWGQKAFEVRDSFAFQLNGPLFDPVRDDPEFRELKRELGYAVD